MKSNVIHRFLLIEPRSPAEHVFSRARIPRLGTILLGTMLRNQGYEARVIIEETSGPVTNADLGWADMVGISSITSTIPRAFSLGIRRKTWGKKLFLAGPMSPFCRMKPWPMEILWFAEKGRKPCPNSWIPFRVKRPLRTSPACHTGKKERQVIIPIVRYFKI